MLLNSLILLLLSNAITSRRDKSILYSRVSISILLISALISYDNLSILFLAKGIGIFGGLFHVTATTNTFHIFIFVITSVILLLTSFYPRKVWFKPNSSPNRILFTKLIYYETLITNKMGEQFKIIEYSLIILFIVTGSVFLISTLIGFFGKQVVLSAAIDRGYLFMSLVAILTSVISAVYYLTIIKQIFFDKNDYSLNDQLETLDAEGVVAEENSIVEKVGIKIENVVISSSLSLPVSVITLLITLFIFMPKEIFSLANILALVLFNL